MSKTGISINLTGNNMLEISKLLSIAQEEKKQYDRAEEIKELDLTPLDYQLVRDNKDKRSIELLEAVIEKVCLPNWGVQESTQRIARTETQAIGRAKDILVITGNTKRFFIKVFNERISKFFREEEFVNLTKLTEVFAKVEDEIKYVENCYVKEQEAQERERLRLEEAAANEEKRRLFEIHEQCRKDVVAANEDFRNKLKEIALAIDEHQSVTHKCVEVIKNICIKEQDYPVKLMDVNISHLPTDIADLVRDQGSSTYTLLDNICCRIDRTSIDNATLSINPRDIYKCMVSSQELTSKDIPEIWFQLDIDENGVFACTTNNAFDDWFPAGGTLSEEVMINECISEIEGTFNNKQICIKRFYKNPLKSAELGKFIETLKYSITTKIVHRTSMLSNINFFGTRYSLSDKFLEFEIEKWTLSQIQNIKDLTWKILKDAPTNR